MERRGPQASKQTRQPAVWSDATRAHGHANSAINTRRGSYKVRSVLVVVFTMLAVSSYAQTVSLTDVAQFSDKICNSVPQDGLTRHSIKETNRR
jgi:hypothetical protein